MTPKDCGRVTLAILLFLLSHATQAENGGSDITPESVAINYMSAFFKGDVVTAARLTHRSTLEKLRNGFLAIYEQAKAKGQGPQFLRDQVNADDIDLVKRWSLEEVYVKLQEANRLKASRSAQKAMKQTVVTFVKKEHIDRNSVRVFMTINIPRGNNPIIQNAVCEVAKDNGRWKVIKDVQ